MSALPGNGAEAPFVLAVPSKGRLQENCGGVLRPRRPRIRPGARRPRLSRRDRRFAGRRGRLSVVGRDRRPACGRRRPFRRHRRGPGARTGRRRRRPARAPDAARVRPCQCRRRRAAGLDRRAHDGRSRRRRRDLSRQARRADAGGDQIRQPDPPLLRRAWRRRLPHRREPRRDRGRAGRGLGRTHRRHRHDRRDARRQRAQTPRRRRDPALAGQSRRLADRALERARPGKPRATSLRASRRARRPASRAKCGRACRARRILRSKRLTRGSARFQRLGEDADPHGFVALHCARGKVAELADWLLAQGAERVSVAALEHVFSARNALYEALEQRIGAL